MFNVMNNMYEDDLEDSIPECEGAMSEKFSDYFTRRSHLKEKLEVIEDNVKEAEAQITTLNGLPNLVKAKRIISASIGSHMYHPCRLPRICSIQLTTYTKERISTGRWH